MFLGACISHVDEVRLVMKCQTDEILWRLMKKELLLLSKGGQEVKNHNHTSLRDQAANISQIHFDNFPIKQIMVSFVYVSFYHLYHSLTQTLRIYATRSYFPEDLCKRQLFLLEVVF